MHSLLVFAAVLGSTLPQALAAQAQPIRLSVDASDIARRIVHVREVVPARPGPLALAYPKWIPGNHAPSGPGCP